MLRIYILMNRLWLHEYDRKSYLSRNYVNFNYKFYIIIAKNSKLKCLYDLWSSDFCLYAFSLYAFCFYDYACLKQNLVHCRGTIKYHFLERLPTFVFIVQEFITSPVSAPPPKPHLLFLELVLIFVISLSVMYAN